MEDKLSPEEKNKLKALERILEDKLPVAMKLCDLLEEIEKLEQREVG